MGFKSYGKLLSGDQVVTENGAWDRVHGVNQRDAPAGKVIVNTDSRGRVEYDVDATVEVV